MAESDIAIEVPDIGAFVFKPRTYGGQLRIQAEAARTLGGTTPDEMVFAAALAYQTIKQRATVTPVDWDIDDLNRFDPDEQTQRIFAVFQALSDEESRRRDRFRGIGA